jgi:tetratricopeptide (TPR) repeat protein
LGLLERLLRQQHTAGDELLARAEEAVAVFEPLGDDAGLARAWRTVATAHQMQLQYGAMEAAAERAVEHASAVRDFREHARSLDLVCTALLYGPTPAAVGVRRSELLLTSAKGRPQIEANVLASLGGLRAMLGDFDRARAHVDEAAEVYERLGLFLAGVGLSHVAAFVELLAGRPEHAHRRLRGFYDLLPDGLRGVHALQLAQVTYQLGDYDETKRLLDVAEGTARGLRARLVLRSLQARLEARSGRVAAAVAMARDSGSAARETDALNMRGETQLALAEVLRLAGRDDEAAAAETEALHAFEKKGNLVAMEQMTALLAERVR